MAFFFATAFLGAGFAGGAATPAFFASWPSVDPIACAAVVRNPSSAGFVFFLVATLSILKVFWQEVQVFLVGLTASAGRGSENLSTQHAWGVRYI
jgi:hypothetical protein